MPLTSVGLLCVIVLIATVFVIASVADKGATIHDEVLVRKGLAAKTRYVEQSITPVVIRDEAISHLDHQFDAEWAKRHIVSRLRLRSGFEQIFVIDGLDQVRLSQKNAKYVSSSYFDGHAATFLPLLARLRAEEGAIVRLNGEQDGEAAGSKPPQLSAMASLDGEVYLLTASLVQPDFGASLPRHARAPVVITALRVNRAFLTDITERLLLESVHLHPGGSAAHGSDGRVPLRDLNGQLIATIAWTPANPGKFMLGAIALPITLVVAALTSAIMLVARRTRKIAEGLAASEARATRLALHDALTGLANRLLFEQRTLQALDALHRRRGTMAVLAIDLDRFKAVNDTYGHGAGDELIRAIAERLTGLCRGHDTVARLGGDEFAIVAADIDPSGAAALAERLVKTLSDPVDLSCGQVFVGGSIGVTMISDLEDDVGVEEAVRRADVAMYRAKEQGRGRYCFFEIEMDLAVKARRALEADLRRSLGDGSVTVAYQPQIDAHDRMIGVEALARWMHPTRGAISPASFVPLAEDCGLIDELGELLMRQAFEESVRWRGIKVAVNVSAMQIKQTRFPDRMQALVAETGADPHDLELEITEAILLGDDEDTRQVIQRLRDMGFSIALDDFGTGYSSLSYLRRYPINKIKIDRSFIAPLGESEEATALVATIVRLAQVFQVSVIAEGVETQFQRDHLREIGCTQAQGFLFSAAVSAEEIDALIKGGGFVDPNQRAARHLLAE